MVAVVVGVCVHAWVSVHSSGKASGTLCQWTLAKADWRLGSVRAVFTMLCIFAMSSCLSNFTLTRRAPQATYLRAAGGRRQP